MSYRILYPASYVKRAKKFLHKHPEVRSQYQKTLELLEVNPHHPSLRLHKLEGRLSALHSVSINISYRVVLHFTMLEKEIVLVDIGGHDQVYRA